MVERLPTTGGIKTIQTDTFTDPLASIDTRHQSRRAQAEQFSGDPGSQSVEDMDAQPSDGDGPNITPELIRLYQFIEAKGDICHLLPEGEVLSIGIDAVRQWRSDDGSRSAWKQQAERALDIACQETEGDESKDWPFENASDIHYPILTTAAGQFGARASGALIKGDKVVGVKSFLPPPIKPSPVQAAAADPNQPQNDQQAQAAMQAIATEDKADQLHDVENQAREARAERVKQYMNWTVFYKMDNWEGETDVLLHEMPITGTGFKKVYMGPSGLCSDYVSALRLTVQNNTKSMQKCPRITQDFEEYPNDIRSKQRSGIYQDVNLPYTGEDPDRRRQLIEQHRLDDLDGDGLAEPYIVTVDIETQKVLRIEPAFGEENIFINEETGKVKRIERWLPFPAFIFLPDPRGRFYGMGFGRLLDAISESIDTSINQLIDAGHAEIAGGGFIGSGVRLQGAGQGGNVFQRPGEYQTVATQGPSLKEAIWERTLPHPSAVTMQLLELLLAAAKDISSVKDVITGDTPATAPVGTTLALQDQALQVFSSIYKRIYRGFHTEFRLMYQCLQKWATQRERDEYHELTGGDFDADFTGDGTDIAPVADPAVVSKAQKIARVQTLMQLAESPVGMAAGMTQKGPAQTIIREALEALDYDRAERYLADVPPNPMAIAKTQEVTAAAQLKAAQAQSQGAAANLDHAKALRETGLAAKDTHDFHAIADQIQQTGMMTQPEGANGPQVPGQNPQVPAAA